jgi:RNA polymerase sigma factor (sigma-70 family)
MDPLRTDVADERRHLLRLAYRLLGTTADAEDVLQETYLRWYSLTDAERAAIRTPGAWLTTVASRICLDLLGSARMRRERYVGEWIPEPVPTGESQDLADRVSLDESIHMAFLVILDSMTPAERVTFVLHDVFRYPFAEIAGIVGRSPEACRQLATSARRRLRAGRTPPAPAPEQAAVVRAFTDAWTACDIDAIVQLLDPEAVAVADSGGHVSAEPSPITGAAAIAHAMVAIARTAPDLQLTVQPVNGQPGLVADENGVPSTVISFDIAAGRIRSIWVVRNPQKLRLWRGR